MKNQLMEVLKAKGINPIIKSIDLTIKDLKALDYDKSEILETLQAYKGLDYRIDLYIKERV